MINRRILTLSLACCATALLVPAAEKTQDRGKSIYSFEHSLLSNWVHHSDGAFFKSLQADNLAKLRGLANEFVDADFAGDIEVNTVKSGTAYALTFEEPQQAPHCYHAIVVKLDDGFAYYTLEKGIDLLGSDNSTMLCSWTKDGTHVNHGPRDYTDLKTFAKEALTLSAD